MRISLVAGLASVGLLALATSGQAASLPAPPSKAAVTAACQPGTDPQKAGADDYPGGLSQRGGGLTPKKLPGATTVSVKEAKCIIDKFGSAVAVIAAMDESDRLANSYTAVMSGSSDAKEQKAFVDWLGKVADGRKDRPLIFYCHHESCFLSYNLALRAVQASYSQVYWMRPGINGWFDAGYALASKPPKPGEKTVSSKVAPAITACNKSYNEYSAEDWAGMVTQIPTEARQEETFQKKVKDDQRMLGICLDNEIRSARGAADKAALQAARAKSDADVLKTYLLARQAMEANPAKYLVASSSIQPELRDSLSALRAYKTLDQTCGVMDFNQPPVGPEYNASNGRRVDRMNGFIDCINAYNSKPSLFSERFAVESANKWAKAVRRYTCGAGWKLNCLPNEPYNSIARLADESGVGLAQRVDQLSDQQYARYRTLGDQLRDWQENYHRRVAAYNASH